MMRRELHYFDIYPKTVLEGEKTEICIRPLGSHMKFKDGNDYQITIIPMTETIHDRKNNKYEIIKTTAENNKLTFSTVFAREQEYCLRVVVNEKGAYILLKIYALKRDLYDRVPLKGDLHVHSTYSDGGEAPEIVAANFRKAGFDFTVISDHCNYEGSLAAIQFYKDAPIDLLIVPGEEIHTPDNHIHIVNFGGEFSVNKIYQEDEARYYKEVEDIAKTIEIPEEAGCVSRFEYAACVWAYNNIRRGNGLAIYVHPHWIVDAYNVSDDMTRFQFKNKTFDAFELCGGISATENNMQLAIYWEAKSNGYGDFPIVGSSDAHHSVLEGFEGSSFRNNVEHPVGFGIDMCKTIVFAKKNDKDDIIASIKDGYSVAVDNYKEETPRVHGSYRLTSYALFLLSEYFPIHDDLCYEEGRVMKAFATESEENALEVLAVCKGRVGRLIKKYFGKEI